MTLAEMQTHGLVPGVLTFGEALRTLPVLARAEVAAGANGLERPIRWTHIVDHAEVLSWVRAGDLLLTTAFALKDNPDSELVMIERLAQQGIAGMLVSIGRYIRTLPPETLAAADALDFPIVTIPWEVPLVEVTHALHERIIGQQYALNEQTNHIHRVLSQLVLDGGGLPDLAQRLSELLRCSVTIEDESLHLQAYATLEPMDAVRRRSIAEGATPPEVIEHLRQIGLFERLKETPRPQRVPPAPEIGLEMERIIAPILVGQDCYGYLWIIASGRSLGELDSLAIERAAHIAALIISREQSVYAAEQRIKARLMENLMDPAGLESPYALQDLLQQFGLKGRFQVMVIESAENNPARMTALVRQAERLLAENDLPGAVLEWGRRLLLLLETGREPTPRQIAGLLSGKNGVAGQRTIGISAPADGAQHVQSGYRQALQALQAGLALEAGHGGVWQYERLGYLPWLQNLPPEVQHEVQQGYFGELIERIRACDRENQTEYLLTLETYLDHHLNASHTAQALFIHRNTLLKRLQRLQELWTMDWEDPYYVLNLHLALKHHRLLGG